MRLGIRTCTRTADAVAVIIHKDEKDAQISQHDLYNGLCGQKIFVFEPFAPMKRLAHLSFLEPLTCIVTLRTREWPSWSASLCLGHEHGARGDEKRERRKEEPNGSKRKG